MTRSIKNVSTRKSKRRCLPVNRGEEVWYDIVNPISYKQELELLCLVAAEAVEKASREIKTHTPKRSEVDQMKLKLAGLTNIPVNIIANEEIKRVLCPIPGCGRYPVNSCCELKKHLGMHLSYDQLPFKCGHDGCGYAAYQLTNFNNHTATHGRAKQLKCGLPYRENGEDLLCGFIVSTVSKLHDHQKGLWNPRHRKAHESASVAESLASSTVSWTTDPSAYASPVATSVALTDASSSSTSASPYIRLASWSSTRATSLTPVDKPVSASKTFPSGTWPSITVPKTRGGITGCFSLHPRDRDSFLYSNILPPLIRMQYGDHELSAFLTMRGCGR